MICEKIDLYDYFSVPRNGKTGGYLTAYAPTPNRETTYKIRPAMLVVPGGGYTFVSEREAEPVALAYVGSGFASFVLQYTVNTPHPVPLQEAAMAVVYIRENARKYAINKNYVAAIGFSAGGHLVGTLATLFDAPEVKELLSTRTESARPDAVVLSYAVISTQTRTHSCTAQTISGGDLQLCTRLSVENCIDGNSSPAFIWHTRNDELVPIQNAFMAAQSYENAGVPYELHIFEDGRHGLSVCSIDTENEWEGCEKIANVRPWFDLSVNWLRSRGFGIKVAEREE